VERTEAGGTVESSSGLALPEVSIAFCGDVQQGLIDRPGRSGKDEDVVVALLLLLMIAIVALLLYRETALGRRAGDQAARLSMLASTHLLSVYRARARPASDSAVRVISTTRGFRGQTRRRSRRR
jgi:hypothetical protein